MPEYTVLPVQPVAYDSSDKELRAIRVWSCVSHGQQIRPVVSQDEVFICKLFTIDRFPPSTVVAGEVAALKHELGNDTVKSGTLVVQRFPAFAYALLSGAKTPKIFSCFGSFVREQFHHDPLGRPPPNNDVEKHLGVLCHFGIRIEN